VRRAAWTIPRSQDEFTEPIAKIGSNAGAEREIRSSAEEEVGCGAAVRLEIDEVTAASPLFLSKLPKSLLFLIIVLNAQFYFVFFVGV
jgi:hypothetical protein